MSFIRQAWYYIFEKFILKILFFIDDLRSCCLWSPFWIKILGCKMSLKLILLKRKYSYFKNLDLKKFWKTHSEKLSWNFKISKKTNNWQTLKLILNFFCLSIGQKCLLKCLENQNIDGKFVYKTLCNELSHEMLKFKTQNIEKKMEEHFKSLEI